MFQEPANRTKRPGGLSRQGFGPRAAWVVLLVALLQGSESAGGISTGAQGIGSSPPIAYDVGRDADPPGKAAKVSDCEGDEFPKNPAGLQRAWGARFGGGDLEFNEAFGIWVDRRTARLYVTVHDTVDPAGNQNVLVVYDICDPSQPVEVGRSPSVPELLTSVETMRWAHRELALVSAGPGFEVSIENQIAGGVYVMDVTDPSDIRVLAFAHEFSSHDLAVVPGTPYAFSAMPVQQEAIAGHVPRQVIPVLNVANPRKPVWHTFPIPNVIAGRVVTSDGCHAISVRVDLGRAYCAGGGSHVASGGGESFVWDLSHDVLNPVWLGAIDDPRIDYHHTAIASEDGTHLYVGDEDIQPCDAGDGAASPDGAIWVYNIEEPASPRLVNIFQVAHRSPTTTDLCGQHFGSVIAGTGLLAWSWYRAGAVLIDARDPAKLRLIANVEARSSWGGDADSYKGYIFRSGQDRAGDIQAFRVV